MNKKIKIVLVTVVVALVAIIGASIYIYTDGQNAVTTKDQPVQVEISGTHNEVLDQLDASGLLKNRFVASVYLKLNNYEFIANTYVLNKNMNLEEIFTILQSGDFNYIAHSSLTVIEGTTIPTVAEAVAIQLEVPAEEVIAKWADKEYLQSLCDTYWFLDESILSDELLYPLEGYLAPETYVFAGEDPTIESVTTMMLEQMNTVLEPYREDIQNFTINGNPVTIHQFLSFASVVQNETLFEVDHAKIAGVFMHRLETDMPLQSDVTVNYANQIKKIEVDLDDLAVDSKYNTYIYKGLPIGPISNVSAGIIEACLQYEQTDALFFFAIQGGEVIYTTTYEEHEEKIAEYREKGLWLED